MISETSIYQILKGLSNGERKIFSKALKQQKKPEEYIQVYSYLIRKNSYDNRIRMKIINICGTKQKSRIVKKYLFELALKIIKSESPVSLFRQLNQNLIDIEILYNRGLFDEMNKLIQKGMKLAKEAEETEFLLILLRWQEFYFGATSGKNKKIIASISEEREETIESINEVNSIEKIYKIVLGQVKETYHDRKGIRIKEGNLQVDKIKSFMGLIRYYEIQSIIAFQSINYHSFHEWNKKILSLVESKKIWLEIHKEEYILFLSTCLYSSSLINDLTDIEKYLSKLNDLETNNSIIKICKYRELIPSKLFFILNSEVNVNRIEKAIIELVEQYSEIKQNLDIEGSMIIIGNFALAYFKIKRFEEAHYWNNQLLSIKNIRLWTKLLHNLFRIRRVLPKFS